jgi:hypothetical protein
LAIVGDHKYEVEQKQNKQISDPANDANAVKTEFTFEPPGGATLTGVQNGRKRKLDTNEELVRFCKNHFAAAPKRQIPIVLCKKTIGQTESF